MVPTIIAAIFDGTPQLTASKPSDILGMVMIGGLFLFFLWACVRVAGSFDKFIRGVAWMIVLAFVALVLIVLFQAGHPGQ